MSTPLMRLLMVPALGVLLLTTACTILPPRKDMSQFFILSPQAQGAENTHANSQRQVSLGLGPINFPGYLKRRQVVTRINNDQLQLSENKLWAESLDANFQRVLSQDLAMQLHTQRVVLFPWFGNPPIDYRIEVQVHRFDTDAANQSELIAGWVIKDGKTGQELFSTDSNISSAVSLTDTAGSQALSNDVNTLSVQIAQSIERLSAAPGKVASQSF